ncbi:MAG TPA: NAD(P)/FAD-dependent oxidoreductase, partial [Candidatus Limnocylindrales bacterium]
DAIVVGAGHNGLVAAAQLARAGWRVLVLEARDRVGGAATTGELGAGFRVPTLAHTVGRLRPSVVRDLRLKDHGLSLVAPEVRAFAPSADGSAITLWADVARTAEGLRARSGHDAARYADFDRLVRSLGRFLADMAATAPPDIAAPTLSAALTGLKLGRSFRGLGRRDARTVLRVLPMAVADLVAESFETDALRAAIAVRGVLHTATGPWSAGSAFTLLADSAGNDGGAAGQTVFARGGPGALAEALASAIRAAGGEIRTNAPVAQVTERDGRASGVALDSGEEIASAIVVAGIDPKRLLMRLVDPVTLGPTLAWRAGNIRTPGRVAKVNLALAGLPRFTAAGDDGDRLLRGRILVAPGIDALEHAFDASKYGRMSEHPLLEATIPSLVDPSLVEGARLGRRKGPAHVMSVVVQWMPFTLRDGDWDAHREELGDLVVRELETVAPGIGKQVVARQVITPLDLERDYGLTGGHPFHGEFALDQFFLWRPLLGHARYRMPLAGLYLAGSGAHPGGGITGAPGANAAREILADGKRRR